MPDYHRYRVPGLILILVLVVSMIKNCVDEKYHHAAQYATAIAP